MRCLVCNKEFKKVGNAKTCSKKCSNILKKDTQKRCFKRYWNEYKDYFNEERRRKTEYEERICPTCGNTFRAIKSRNRKYCSDRCKNGVTLEERRCPQCKSIFTFYKNKRKYFCSVKCRNRYNYVRKCDTKKNN